MKKGFFKSYQVKRKLLHIIFGCFFVWFINLDYFVIKEQLEVLIVAFIALSLIVSIYIRYKRPKFLLKVISHFDKPRDMLKFPMRGSIYYLIGVLMSIAFFSRKIASASILILVIGDPAAFFFGNYYGKKRLLINRRKLLEGTIAGVIFGTFAASIFVSWPIAFFGAAFGMIAEAIELKLFNLDDNFSIPFVSGLTMTLLQSLV